MTTLFMQSERGGSIWQVWPVQDAIPPGEVREAASYLFELRDCEDAVAADLLIDDLQLDALRSRDRRVAKWRWTPGFHAGFIQAELRLPGIGKRIFGITTDPDIRKLTRDDFDKMVREILEDTFALFALSAFRKGIARQQGNKPPPIARLEFLRSRANELEKVIDAIGRSPRHSMRAKEMPLPLHRATRATGPEIIKSFRTGVILKETGRDSRLPKLLAGCIPAKITLRQRLSSVDIPEHRQIKACLKSWAAWLGEMAAMLSKSTKRDVKDGDQELVTTAKHWAERARRISRTLSVAASAGFMAEVGEGAAVLHATSLFRNDPVYNRFYRLWQDMNLGLAALFGDFLEMPLARTYELYELWCFLRLLRAGISEYSTEDVDLSSLFTSSTDGGVTLAAGAISVPIGRDLILCFQRRYEEYWQAEGREGTFSREMIPDVVLAGKGLGTEMQTVIVLDAKYRINGGLNDALNSIHTYRDALVREIEDGAVEGIVTAAYLLTPHAPLLSPDFKLTAVPGRLFHPQYRQKFRFGAVTLRPGMSGTEIKSCLRAIVADATNRKIDG
jgi:hypothetical protein